MFLDPQCVKKLSRNVRIFFLLYSTNSLSNFLETNEYNRRFTMSLDLNTSIIHLTTDIHKGNENYVGVKN